MIVKCSHFDIFQPFKIFDGPVQLLNPIRQTGLLACVGRDEEVLLKIFDLVRTFYKIETFNKTLFSKQNFPKTV